MTGTLVAKSAVVALVGALVGGGVAAVLSGDARAADGPVARAWVDEPLHASQHPMGPVEVTVHATDVDTVAAVQVTIDGETVADIEVAEPATLVWESFEWTPNAPGEYQLEVVGVDPSGGRGVVGVATFTVGDELGDPGEIAAPADTTTTTSASTTTSESTTTSTSSTTSSTTTSTTTSTTDPVVTATSVPPTAPTTTSCSPSTPTVTGAVTESISSSGADVRITWTYSGCGPNGFAVVVSSPGNPPVTKNVGASVRSTMFSLPICTDYSVRVQALGSNTSPSSDPYAFETDCG